MNALLLTLSFISTKFFGLDKTANAVTYLARLRKKFSFGNTNKTPTEIAENVNRGLRFLPFPVECLDQALVTWYALNVAGHEATLKIGMKLSPVSGHAWVLCGDERFVLVPSLEDFTVVAEYAGL
jgi:Transglutaminase-like superfamily